MIDLNTSRASESVSFTLEASAEAPGKARAIFWERLQSCGISDENLYVACLVVTELVTNAHKHACVEGEEIVVSVHRRQADARYEIGVRDGSDEPPVIPVEDTEATDGRGLRLVSALAHDWGMRALDGGGKVVWAVLP